MHAWSRSSSRASQRQRPDTGAALQGKRNDVIYTIDIKDVLNGPDVNGTTMPPRSTCDPSDFEEWEVAKENDGGPLCVLGERHTFHRVAATRRETACLLPKSYTLADTKTKVRRPACPASE